MVGCKSAEFGEPILDASDGALMGFGEFWNGGLRVESVHQHLVFFGRPGLAVIGGEAGRNAVGRVNWLCTCSGWLRFRGWRLWLFRRLSWLGVLQTRKVRDEKLDFVAEAVEIRMDAVGLESVWMRGGIANDADNSNAANQDGWQRVREAVDGGKESALRCRVMLVQ